jgi:ADP-heptose:LPS heptosyltransferase
MKRLDRFAGVPICRILSAADAFRRRAPSRGAEPLGETSRVLFIELSEMGSMVAAYPALRSVCERVGPERVYFLTLRQNRHCVDMLKLIPRENVLTLSNDSGSSFLSSSFRCWRTLRALRLDAAIDLELFSRISSIFSYASGARRRVGYHRYAMEGLYRGSFLTHPVTYNHGLHISRNFLALVRALETGAENRPLLKEAIGDEQIRIPRIEADPERKRTLRERLLDICPAARDASRLIILNPNAGDLLPIRAWPLDRYIELGRRLLAEDPRAVLLVMGTDEAAADAARIVAELGPERVVDFAGKTAFEDLLPLFELGELLVTNDSGPAHFAALTPISILAFFGPESPRLYRPLSDRHRALYAEYHCSPCLNAYNHRTTSCTDNRCLQCISVDEAHAAARDLLADGRGGGVGQ